ncbi:MAG: Cell wall surface anchor family protein [Candidatus Azambacteria bacterium GW2011_GWF2_46_32]|uniref:Cell wall surface anchor family protein n=1 Tax=Candidatus Azambacteria bacterium GW2011_GWF2_46_32 TaxID=1618628 RepID=A0A0G1STB4_9BACT|nr:MAG: Cell wall surface anchor family protein [Candidatus Azambacteria bacterium GW2011_GWF2_46_32]
MWLILGNRYYKVNATTNYRPDNYITFWEVEMMEAVSAAPQLIVSTSGNVGIGTTGPNDILHIYNSQDGNTELKIENPNTGTAARSYIRLSNDVSSAQIGYHSSNYTGLARDLRITNNDASGAIRFYFNGGDNVVFAHQM